MITLTNNKLPDSLRLFEKNIENGINHNIYHIEKFNSDGERTGEYFGKNLMTDYGLSILTGSSAPSRYSYWCIVLGYSDSSDIPFTNHTINNTVYSGNCGSNTIYNTSSNSLGKIETYPCEFDKDTNLLYCRQYTAGFNTRTFSSATTINEFGLVHTSSSSHNQNVSYHSKIYDVDGNMISIDIAPNESLVFRMYTTSSINVNTIKNLYDQGLYMFISPKRFVGLGKYGGNYTSNSSNNLYIGMTARHSLSSGYYYNSNNSGYMYGKITSVSIANGSTVSDHVTTSTISGTVSLTNKYDNIRYMIMSIQSSSITLTNDGKYEPFTDFFIIFEPDKLSQPETLITEHGYISDTNGTFNELFGNKRSYCGTTGSSYFLYHDGELPVDDFDMLSVKRYSFADHDWTIDEEFINEPDTRYFSPISAESSYGRPLGEFCCMKDGKPVYAIVIINTRTDLAMLSVKCSAYPGVVYATDEYWDTSTWEVIKKPYNSVETNLQHKRYILFITDNYYAPYVPYITYDIPTQNPHRLVDTKIYFDLVSDYIPNSAFDVSNVIYKGRAVGLSSDEYNWFTTQRSIVYPELQKVYTMNEAPNDIDVKGNIGIDCTRFQTESGDRIVLLYASDVAGCEPYNFNNLRIYDPTNPDVEPTYTDIIQGFGTDWTCTADECLNSIVSWSEKGYLCVQHPTTNKCGIVDIYSNTIQVIDSKWCFVMNGTSHCFYLDTSSNNGTFNIYDIATSSIIGSFSIPYTTSITITGVGGWNDHMYVNATVDGTASTYVYDLSTNTLKSITYNSIFNTYGIYKYTHTNGAISYYTSRSDVSNNIVYILGTSQGSANHSYILDSDPFTIKPFVKNSNLSIYPVSLYKYIQGKMLRYTSEGNLLYLIRSSTSTTTNGCYCQIFDMGHIIDNGGLDKYPDDRKCGSIAYDYSGKMWQGCPVIYKDGLLDSAYSSTTYIRWRSSKWFTPFKITGTTRTITAYNGSINIKPTLKLKFTNDINKVKAIT